MIIDALRGAGYATLDEIAARSGRCERQVLRHLRWLVATRRVVRVLYDDNSNHVLYCLTDQRRAA
jgi:DNA-binding HxlR family transcriptional regulator